MFAINSTRYQPRGFCPKLDPQGPSSEIGIDKNVIW